MFVRFILFGVSRTVAPPSRLLPVKPVTLTRSLLFTLLISGYSVNIVIHWVFFNLLIKLSDNEKRCGSALFSFTQTGVLTEIKKSLSQICRMDRIRHELQHHVGVKKCEKKRRWMDGWLLGTPCQMTDFCVFLSRDYMKQTSMNLIQFYFLNSFNLLQREREAIKGKTILGRLTFCGF